MIDYSGFCSQISISISAQMCHVSQTSGMNDVMDISNTKSVTTKKRKKPETVYSENLSVLKQTVNIIDTDSGICEEFHTEFVALSNKYINIVKKKHSKVQNDTNVISSHEAYYRREVSRQYKPH